MAGSPLSTIPKTYPPTPAALGGVLMAGYPKGHIGQDGITAVRQILVPWDNLDDALAYLQPPSTFVGGSQTINYGAPFPGREYMRVVDIDWSAFGEKTTDLDFNGDYKYEFAQLTVKYGFLKNQQSGGSGPDPSDPVSLLIHRWTIGAEVIKTNTDGLVWDNVTAKNVKPNAFSPFPPTVPAFGDTPDVRSSLIRELIGRKASQGDMKQGPREYIASIEHEITRQRIPRPPFSALRACAGKCNRDPVVLKTGIIPSECLILWGAHLSSTTMSNGEQSWEMSVRFGERQVIAEDQVQVGGWNHFYRENQPEKIKPLYLGPFTAPESYLTKNTWTGRRGFYRLEKDYGTNEFPYGQTVDADNETISPTPPVTGRIGTNLFIGYNEETALIKKADFSKIWLPEPIPPVVGP